jgi:hypothetical protein
LIGSAAATVAAAAADQRAKRGIGENDLLQKSSRRQKATQAPQIWMK